MSIEALDNINTMFSVFHDGEITGHVKTNTGLEIEVHIQYLAKRINPEFRTFSIALQDIESLYFTSWPDDIDTELDIISDVKSIFTKELEILSSEIVNGSIKVACNQPFPDLGYCGGFLNVKANCAIVKDDADKEYSIEALCTLSEGYWDEWSNKNKAEQYFCVTRDATIRLTLHEVLSGIKYIQKNTINIVLKI